MSEPIRNKLGDWIDPEPIRLPGPHGLSFVLYRRAPAPKQRAAPARKDVPPPWMEPDEPRADPKFVQEALARMTPETRSALGLPDGAA